MLLQEDVEKQAELVLTQLRDKKVTLTEDAKEIILNTLKESYGVGYENGLSDGEEITKNPISG